MSPFPCTSNSLLLLVSCCFFSFCTASEPPSSSVKDSQFCYGDGILHKVGYLFLLFAKILRRKKQCAYVERSASSVPLQKHDRVQNVAIQGDLPNRKQAPFECFISSKTPTKSTINLPKRLCAKHQHMIFPTRTCKHPEVLRKHAQFGVRN